MPNCWANSLGRCDKSSGEHVFSGSIFKAGCSCPILIEGVQRIRQGQATRSAEKSNILCRYHNSLLSPLDETIGRVARFQADTNEESFNGSLMIEGELLERWLLKTVVNVAAAGWIGPMKWVPSDDVVQAIFGQAKLPPRIGLYSVDGIDPNHRPSGSASFTPLFLPTPSGKLLTGAYITVHGMPLLASLHDELAARLDSGKIPTLQGRFAPRPKHLYHPGAIVMSRLRGKPVFLGMSWGGLLRYEDGTTSQFPLNSKEMGAT